MIIAVTGGTGFIGQWLLKLYAGGSRFRVMTRSLAGKDDIFKHPSVEYRVTDYSAEDLAVHLDGVDSVIHLAARRDTRTDAIQEYIDNITVSYSLFEACRESGITNIVNISTRSVYSASNTLPYSESQIAVPANFYGVSKLAVENMASLFNAKADMRIRSLRLAQVAGLGERERFMFTLFLNNAAAKRPLLIYGSGSGRREYIYVKDVARAMMLALEAKDAEGVFNIGTGVNCSNRELAETMNEVFDNRGNITFLENEPEDLSISLMDVSKAKRGLGFEARHDLRSALEDMKGDLALRGGNHG